VTPPAPTFTINGFSDISFHQHSGWATRSSVSYLLTRRFSVEPAYIHCKVSASPVACETATFTVNGVAAHEQLGAIEPLNSTNEFVVKFGFRI
jgi:hypothetical protein